MTQPLHIMSNPALDRLLVLVGQSLELTTAQRERAAKEYLKLAQWLSQSSRLRPMKPDIYPQGSARLLTEVRPIPKAKGDAAEHDVDAVAEYASASVTAMELYEWTWEQLSLNDDYRPIMGRKRRCIRLNFKGDFHLDLLPAMTDPLRPGSSSILIPDCDLRAWLSSNPKGFAAWFETRAEGAREALRKSIQALPQLPSHADKPVLNRVVQLWKRRRDMAFLGKATAPRSIVLTTLAATHHAGEAEVAPALSTILARTRAAIAAAAPRRIEVCNPTNAEENFADSWDDLSYRSFTEFVCSFADEMTALMSSIGLERVVGELQGLFGAEQANRALAGYRAEMRAAEQANTLRASSRIGLSTGAVGVIVPKSTHYGRVSAPPGDHDYETS